MAATKRSPPIGSGQYPDDNYDHAAYFRNLHFMRGWLKEVVPSETDPVCMSMQGSLAVMAQKMARIPRLSFGVIDLHMEGQVVNVGPRNFIEMYDQNLEEILYAIQ